MWRSLSDVEAVVAEIEEKDALADLWALHYFIDEAVFTPGFTTNEAWGEIVVLAPAGEELLGQLSTVLTQFSRADISLALFACFYYHDILIDYKRTDPVRVLDRINIEFTDKRVRWPYCFGRTLYDRFNDTATIKHTDSLKPDEVQLLLQGTPDGVYQVGKYLSGPYGIIQSPERRYLPPRLLLPLWHCSDTGCGAVHRVFLSPPIIPPVSAYNRIRNEALEALGPRSEWEKPLNRLAANPRTQLRPGTSSADLPALIGDSVIGPERIALLAGALRTPRATQLRELVAKHGGASRGAPEAVAESMAEAEQFQTLLTLTNAELTRLIDACVLDGRIVIPINEIRSPHARPPRLSSYDRPLELSSLGLRSCPRVPLASLHSTIWGAYKSAGLLDELGWKLRRTPSVPPSGILMDYIQSNEPERVISELVLSSMPVTRALAEALGVPIDFMDRVSNTADLFLWKLGFIPMRFSEEYERLRRRIDEFTTVVLSVTDLRAEAERENARSIGVNLFVSVEHFLEELISYNTWLLSSDHFLGHFRYSPSGALATVPRVLGASVESGNSRMTWSVIGENTLGTLLAYAQRMVAWMATLKSLDRASVKRPGEDLPHYADDHEQAFVFGHTELWADADVKELEHFTGGLSEVVGQLSRSEAATIRNGLDHKRDGRSFPSAESMLACAVRIREALDTADARRFLPKLYWLRSTLVDRVGRQQFVFSDYRRNEISLGGPPVVSGLPKPGFRRPVVIPSGNLLGEPNAELRFSVRADSPYAIYWNNYPRRRRILPTHTQVPEDDNQPPPL